MAMADPQQALILEEGMGKISYKEEYKYLGVFMASGRQDKEIRRINLQYKEILSRINLGKMAISTLNLSLIHIYGHTFYLHMKIYNFVCIF